MPKNLHEISRFLDKSTKSDFDYVVSKVVDQIYLCVEANEPKFTEFLDPMRRDFARAALAELHKYGVLMEESGGYEHAERQKICVMPADCASAQFPIKRVLLEFDAKYGTPGHRDILGAVLGLGLDRSVIGDIVLLVDAAVIFADTKIADFLDGALCKVGKISVSTRILADEEQFFALDNRVRDRIICASLRLDAVLAAAFGLSRGDAAGLVKSGKAQINWREENSPAKLVKPGDMLTFRRFGRIRVMDIAGKSKKDRVIIEIQRF